MVDQQITIEALAITVAAKIPALLWGPPGSGKTATVTAIGKAMGVNVETVIASIREPSDFSGLPFIVDNQVHFAPPKWAHRLFESKKGILFLDEISTAAPAVQAALLRVVFERVVGDLVLPEQIAVIAAANPPNQAADGWDLSGPLANRFCHLDWTVTAQSFAEGLAVGWQEPVIPHLPSNWQNQHLTFARGLVSGFINARPNLASAPPSDPTRAGRAWPSPRTWDMASKLLAAANSIQSKNEVKDILVQSAVGQGPGLEFLTWITEMDLPNPEEILKDPTNFFLPPRADRAYAVLASVATAVASNPTPSRWKAGWQILAKAGDSAPDVAAMAARILARCRPPGAIPPSEVKAFIPLLKQAGLLSP